MLTEHGSVFDALNVSIDAAITAGRIDPDAQAVLIEAARKVAHIMDEPDWPIICKDAKGNGKQDNVSPSVLLKYCDALGICPSIAADDRKRNKGDLSKLRGDVKKLRLA